MIEKNYYRIMLGAKSKFANECYNGGFIGGDWGFNIDLSNQLPDDWKAFNKQFIPIFLENRPEKSKIAAGLACGMLWTICMGINKDDLILSPNGQGGYYVGEVIGNYEYVKKQILPHRRKVTWYPKVISRESMSQELRNSAGSIATVSKITKYADEISQLLQGNEPQKIISTDNTVENASEFALEKHLEDFLVTNWHKTDLGDKYDIYEDEGEIVGQQYPCDTGLIDILAISKDKKELLVVELKKGRASDNVVGQIQRYMGYVIEELAESNQTVRGIIIAHNDNLRIRRALSVTNNIEFYHYNVTFNLFKSSKK